MNKYILFTFFFTILWHFRINQILIFGFLQISVENKFFFSIWDLVSVQKSSKVLFWIGFINFYLKLFGHFRIAVLYNFFFLFWCYFLVYLLFFFFTLTLFSSFVFCFSSFILLVFCIIHWLTDCSSYGFGKILWLIREACSKKE